MVKPPHRRINNLEVDPQNVMCGILHGARSGRSCRRPLRIRCRALRSAGNGPSARIVSSTTMRPPQFARLDDPQLLICETCLDTGRGISEAVGLQSKHFDPQKGAIRIEQRHCRGDVDQPKTKNSKRTLALGTLVGRFRRGSHRRRSRVPTIGSSFRRRAAPSPCGTRECGRPSRS